MSFDFYGQQSNDECPILLNSNQSSAGVVIITGNLYF